MAANQNVQKFEQRPVIKSLVSEKCKPCKIYRKMCDVYGQASFSKKKYLQMD